jgi:type II secretory pathway pseudopilin PulG
VRWSGRGTPREDGFTLVAVVVMMAVMAILLTVAVETVSFQQRREKEEELIFRGNQVVEAIRLFRARNGRFPLNLGELVTAKPRVLRKTWADPMTGKPDWEPVFLGEEGETVAGGTPPGTPGPKETPEAEPTPGQVKGPTMPGGAKVGAIIGVHSRSCEESIKLYEGRTRYCDWKFYFDPNKKPGPQAPGPSPTPPR